LLAKKDSMSLAKVIANAAFEKQATDVVILDLRGLDAVTDCFVICTGGVNQQVRAIAENIEQQVKKNTDDRLLHREGTDTLNWVILDYVNVVVHVFKPSFREFYRLEDLWGDAELLQVSDNVTKSVKPKPARRTVPPRSSESVKPKAARKPVVKKPATSRKSSASRTPTRSKATKPKS
jgi:ribosome-associated protein